MEYMLTFHIVNVYVDQTQPRQFKFTFKNKGDVQSCSNYKGIKLISHTMKLWERIVEKRLRSDLKFSNQQYGFMPGKSTTDALFALRVLMEKYREGQKELHCVFVDLEKAYDNVPREEV